MAAFDSTSTTIRTQSGRLREWIEELILTGVFRPGAKLDEADLAKRFGVSRTPIREVLIQLASVGMIDIRPRRGAVVPAISAHKLVEMFEVMAELEGMCGRLAARRMSAADHARVTEAHELSRAAVDRGDTDAYYLHSDRFHQLIHEGSHNEFLSEQISNLRLRLYPYRRLQLRIRDRMALSFSEHHEILSAMIAGNSELSGQRLREHVLVQGDRFTDLMALLHRGPESTA
jgi:DNA-binding GntR family transcriptional regulator